MKITNLVCTLVMLAASAVGGASFAAGDLTAQTPIEVKVLLGDQDNALRFSPDRIELETGKLYKLILHNPSAMPHYFSSEGLARAV